MPDPVQITAIRLTATPPGIARTGLIGWIRCTYGSLVVDGLALRRTFDGRLTLSYPARRDGGGKQQFYVRPLDDDTRRSIESQVFEGLGIREAPS